MKRRSFDGMSIFELASAYETTALEYGEAMDAVNPRKANRRCDRLILIHKEIKRRGTEGHALLLRMMTHSSRWVRLDAAYCALRFAPGEAETVLQEVASGPYGACRASASWALQEWRKGTLQME